MAWVQRLRNAAHRERLGNELDREFTFHLKERVDELRASGLSEREALDIARRQFGNLTAQKEKSGDMHVSVWLESILRNLRLGLRSLRRTPTLTAAVIITLALGIGANSAVFSVIDAILLRPLPFPESDQLVRIAQRSPRNPATVVAPVRLEDWNRMNSTFQAITGYYVEDLSETSGELPERLRRAFVSQRFVQVWGVAPALGRDFSPEEGQPGGPAAVLISDRLWRRRFGANSDVVGKKLRFGTLAPTVIGVMPASFLFPDREVDLWWLTPTPATPSRAVTWFTAIGRLKPGVSLKQARADLSTTQAQLGAQFPETDANLTIEMQPLKEETVGGVRRSLWIVFGSVSLLLLIACANIAALLLSRTIQSKQEIAIRFSLGASRSSVAAQLFTETGILAFAGAAIGLALAAAGPPVFRALAGNLPRVHEVRLDWRIAMYSLACAVLATLLCGLIPALRSTRRGIAAPGVQSGRSQVSGRNRVQWLLVGTQVALAVTLLAGAGLLLRSFQALGQVTLGFEPRHVLTFRISGSYAETSDFPGLYRRIDETLDFLKTIPGVQASATVVTPPGIPVVASQQSELRLTEGAVDPDTKVLADNRFVSSSYFATMQIPLIAGEACPARIVPAPGAIPFPSVDVVVNRSFANRYLPATGGIGRHIEGESNRPPGLIRGMVGDARESGPRREPVPTAYWCFSAPGPVPFFLVRTSGEPAAMIETIRRKIHEIEPRRSVFDLMPLTDRLDNSVSENRLRTLLLVIFAVTAVLLACVGLYSTLGYLVTVKRREIGLRIALGAERGRIVKHFLRKGLGVTTAAIAAGLALALAFTRVLSGMLYGVSPYDPATLGAVVLIVILVGSMASLVPAVRAGRVEPMKVLREE